MTNSIFASVTDGSPAQAAGLRAADRVLEVDGTKATPKTLNDLLAARKSGDRIQVRFSRDNTPQDVEVVLAGNTKRSFALRPAAHPTGIETAILKDWMRAGQ